VSHTATSEGRLALPRTEGFTYSPSITVRLFRAQPPVQGTVVFLHGLGYCRRDYEFLETTFTDRGYHLAHYALRGHPGGEGTFSIQGCADDLSRVLDALQGRVSPRPSRFAVMGHSTGALIALEAARFDQRIAALAVISTITSLGDALDHVQRNGRAEECFWALHRAENMHLSQAKDLLHGMDWRDGLRRAMLEESRPLRFSCRYGMLRVDNYEEFLTEIVSSPNAVQHAGAVLSPVTLFCGRHDEIIDPQNTRILYDRLGAPPSLKQITVLDAEDHFLNGHWGRVVRDSLSFFGLVLSAETTARA
jgi:alpha-beta hydrolase superfamily lysophospholipase